ncbi:hypothetical protein BS50DRAFT_324137 [Corynespora cassiicola Philippines]|uniref:Uncharacterized protein n=1 Tax=Corynespora cassiicola Philippines TaxID=1448308 RepID=A0A2T2NTK9_CORCC|nr:hypothetical protein BS50DRAFT_324137 [Corynespora cassiicola Philippines]
MDMVTRGLFEQWLRLCWAGWSVLLALYAGPARLSKGIVVRSAEEGDGGVSRRAWVGGTGRICVQLRPKVSRMRRGGERTGARRRRGVSRRRRRRRHCDVTGGAWRGEKAVETRGRVGTGAGQGRRAGGVVG